MYKLAHSGTVVQGEGVDGTPSLGFRSEQNDTISVGFRCHSTPFDPPSRICYLGFYYFRKSQEIREISTTSSQNAYELYKLVNFWNLTTNTGKIKN